MCSGVTVRKRLRDFRVLDLDYYCRAMLFKRVLCCHTVSVLPFVCLSVRQDRHPKSDICHVLSKSIKVYLVFFFIPDVMSIFNNAGIVGKNRDSDPISDSIACCERFERQVQYAQLRRTMMS